MSEHGGRPSYAEIEGTLCATLAEVLKVDEVRPGDGFSALGGTSLQGMRLTARLRAQFGVRLPVDIFLFLPTTAEMAEYIEQVLADAEVHG